jgi:hypothetical protein
MYTDPQYAEPEPERDARAVITLDRLILSKSCAPVWRMTEVREADASRRRKALLTARYGHSDFFEVQSSVGFLLDAIVDASEGVPSSEDFSLADRRAKGRRIAKLARRLEQEMAQLHSQEDELPFGFETGLAAFASDAANSWVTTGAEFMAAHNVTKETLKDAVVLVQCGALAVVFNERGFLRALESTANEWSNTEPPIAHANDATALRRYFIRKLTAHMRSTYGTPLRAHVATLTRVLFDCEMDAATVAKLAR